MSEIEIPPRILETLKSCYFKRPSQIDRQHAKVLLRMGLIERVPLKTMQHGVKAVYHMTATGKKIVGVSS